jgi:hypothetical protein
MSMRARLSIGSAARVRALGLFAASVLALQAAPALSQSAVGGSIGKQDKSVSGGGDEGGSSRSTSHERERERPSRSERERPSRGERSASRSSGGGSGASFDGTWAVASSGNPCGSSKLSLGFSSGRIVSPAGFSGSVSGGGSLHGSWSSNSFTGTFSGRLSSGSGSGSFRRSDGCVGSISLVKQ